MKPIYAVAAVSLVAVVAAGCKPAPAPTPPPAPAPAEAAPAAPAAAPALLEVTKTISIDATADTVWAKIKDFDKLNTWHPAVAKDEIVEGKNNEVGAVRLLTLAGEGGGTIKEKLTAFDDATKTVGYTIVEGVLPVADYNATIVVAADGDKKATVTWSGKFKAAEKADDKTATDTITGVYTTGLDNLKKVLETK